MESLQIIISVINPHSRKKKLENKSLAMILANLKILTFNYYYYFYYFYYSHYYYYYFVLPLFLKLFLKILNLKQKFFAHHFVLVWVMYDLNCWPFRSAFQVNIIVQPINLSLFEPFLSCVKWGETTVSPLLTVKSVKSLI